MKRWIVPAATLSVLCLSLGASAQDPPPSYPVDWYAQDVKVGDFNGDGRPDLVVASVGSDTVSVLLGNGDGTLQTARSTAAMAQSLLTGDLDGDGSMDLVALDPETAASTLLGNGDGTFQSPSTIVLPPQSPAGYSDLPQVQGATALGDVDGDGTLDLVAGGTTSAYEFDEYYWDYVLVRTDGYLNVMLGNGDGTFRAGTVEHLGEGAGFGRMDVVDLDGDGRADVLADGILRLGNGDGTLQAPRQTSAYGHWGFPQVPQAVWDFDRDGRLDLIVQDIGSAVVFRGGGDGTLESTGSPVPLGEMPQSLVVGDVDGDAVLDLVVVTASTTYAYCEYHVPEGQEYGFTLCYDPTTVRSAAVLRGRGDGTFGLSARWDLGTVDWVSFLVSAALVDLDGDGLPELAVAEKYRATILVAHNDGQWPAPSPFIRVDDTTAVEGDDGTTAAVFTVRLDAPFDQEVAVGYGTVYSPDTVSDFVATSGTVRFAPGETSKTITVQIVGDLLLEGPETFTLALANAAAGAPISDGYGVCTILDNDRPIDLAVGNVARAEGDSGSTAFEFVATLSSAYVLPVTVQYYTSDGSARSAARKRQASDYEAASGLLTFAPGETTKRISVQVRGDRTAERDETFLLNAFYSVQGLYRTSSGQGTILNDD